MCLIGSLLFSIDVEAKIIYLIEGNYIVHLHNIRSMSVKTQDIWILISVRLANSQNWRNLEGKPEYIPIQCCESTFILPFARARKLIQILPHVVQNPYRPIKWGCWISVNWLNYSRMFLPMGQTGLRSDPLMYVLGEGWEIYSMLVKIVFKIIMLFFIDFALYQSLIKYLLLFLQSWLSQRGLFQN